MTHGALPDEARVLAARPSPEITTTAIVRAYTHSAAGLLGALWVATEGLLAGQHDPPTDAQRQKLEDLARRVGRDAMRARRLLQKAARCRE